MKKTNNSFVKKPVLPGAHLFFSPVSDAKRYFAHLFSEQNRLIRNQEGIALLMVLFSIVLLVT
jgi:hypothetical protein